jgi:hypothetical protein
MRPARLLLLAVALLAAALTGWALGARDDDTRPGADPAVTQAPPAAAAPNDPAPRGEAAADGTTPSGNPAATTRPVPKPRIFGFGSEPVLPEKNGVWQLPPSAGILTLVTGAEHATKVEFLLSSAGDVAPRTIRIGQDTTGRDGYWTNWHYKDEPLYAYLTVRATGPGGTAEKTVGVLHPRRGELNLY